MTASRSFNRRAAWRGPSGNNGGGDAETQEGSAAVGHPEAKPVGDRPDVMRTSVPWTSDVSRTDRFLPIAMLCTAAWLAGVHPCHAQRPPRRGGLESLLDGPAPEASPTPPAEKPRPATPAARTTEPARKLPRPDAAAVREAVDLVQQAYGDDLRQGYERAVGMMLKAVNETTDAARRYALLSVAEQAAIDAGDTDLALDVVGRRTTLFDEDGMRARHAMFLKLRKAVKKPDAALFAFAVTTAEEAAAAEEYDLADGAADVALEIAVAIDREEKRLLSEYRRIRRPQQPPPEATAKALIADAKQLQRTLQDARRTTSEFNDAEKRLLANPSDAEATRLVGEYLCFVKRQWNRGLKYLARAGTEPLRELAAQELALPDGSAADPGARFRLAGAWWRLAESGPLAAAHAAAVRAHAAAIYDDVVSQLSDPTEKALARKRSGREPEAPPADPPKSQAAPPAGGRTPK